MERRRFLMAGAALAARASAQQPPPPKAKITSSVMLWTLKGSFEEKLEAAARAGVQSVELVDEHVKWTDAELARNRKRCASFGLGIDAITAARPENFLAGVREAIVFAQKLEAPQIIVPRGNRDAVKRAGEIAAEANVTLLVEQDLKLVREAANPHVKLLFDIYQQVQAGNVIGALTEAAPYVAVFHVADSPGRHEPGTGELNWPEIYKTIQKSGYGGYLTMEYIPTGEPVATLIKALDGFRTSLL